uniref:MAM domain-containing protein n=1 Tax=Setaria digitata TaxID=48799 RepID=A0A915PKU0_9BILA
MQWMVLSFLVIESFPYFINGCTPRYQEELQYLDHYLGIEPENQGNLPVAETTLKHYINNPSKLTCQFNEPCAWINVPDDNLLDTSDFYLFVKKNAKPFPAQVQPGPPDPLKGTKFILAGNTTSKAQSAVLVSAPIACQRTSGSLTFKYWLYNEAKIETLILKPSTRRNRLRVILRLLSECYFLRAFNDHCRVEIPEIVEPFRIGIRVYGLKDSALGSFGMLTDIEYNAEICLEPKLSTVFGSRAVPPSLSASYPITASELSCPDYNSTCRWSNSHSSSAEWKIGWNRRRWREIFGKESKPTGTFFYQYVDSIVEKPYSVLRSELIPCTSTITTLSFRYWLQHGTQVQTCIVTASNIIISCVYLSELTIPGPISIDLDVPTDEPFRFIFEMINFDNSTEGLVVIDDLQFTGLLCHEVTMPPTTTINPLQIRRLFSLQSYPQVLIDSIPTLNCDFNRNTCPQWENDGNWFLGMVPSADPFLLPSSMKDQVLVAVLNKSGTAILQSREVPCASKARIFIAYFRTENSGLMVCIEKHCVNTRDEYSAKSTGPGLTIIRKIETTGNWCPLQSLTQHACKRLTCIFQQTFCDYKTETNSRANVLFRSDSEGLTVSISKEPGLAILRSPQFQLPRPIELQIEIYQSTFGSQTYLCGDVFSTLYDCRPILGPKIELPTTEKVILPLDQDAQNFTIIAVHDKFTEFGAAKFVISKIEVVDEDGKLLC